MSLDATRLSRIAWTVPVLLTGLALSGCSTVGVTSIDQGRTPYNDVIQDTAKQQALLNVVRVRNGDTPLFLDVGEVDQVTTATGSLTGGPSQIGAVPGHPGTTAGSVQGLIGAVAGTATYSEAPTVRYIPLSGQQLISQVSTPLTPETISNLQTSDWPLPAILQLGVNRLTLKYGDYAAALDTILELDAYGAVIIAATQAPEKSRSINLAGVLFSSNPAPAKDNLTFYAAKGHASGIQAVCENKGADRTNAIVDVLWRRLRSLSGSRERDAEQVSIRSRGSYGLSPTDRSPPLLQTRSALGITRTATGETGSPTIAFVSADDARAIMEDHEPRDPRCRTAFYTLDPARFTADGSIRPSGDRALSASETQISSIVRRRSDPLLTMLPDVVDLSPLDLDREITLLRYRRFMLIVVSDERPADAFVSASYQGKWYYILRDDRVSKRTLALISQFNTVQATTNQTPPLTPTITVGPR